MLEIGNLVPTLLKRLQALSVGHCLEVRSYKRDRAILIIKEAAER